MTVTTAKQRTTDRYMEHKKIEFVYSPATPSQQVGFISSSSAQSANSTVPQTPPPKKLSVNFLLNSPEEQDDPSPLQQVHQTETTFSSDKFTFLPSSNHNNLQTATFQNNQEHSQNTFPTQPSKDLYIKRVLDDDSNPPSKRSKSESDNFVNQSNHSVFSRSFPVPIPSLTPLSHPQQSFDPSALYFTPIKPMFELSNLQSKSLPTPASTNTSFQDLLLAATTIEGGSENSSPVLPASSNHDASPNQNFRRATKYAPAPKNSPGPPNGAYFDEQWMMRYQQLKKFKNQNGHTNVTRTKQEWRSLGNWVCEQRRKVRAGKLTEQQFQLLDDLGFEWDRSYYFRPGADSDPADGEIADLTTLQQQQQQQQSPNNNNNNNHSVQSDANNQ